MINLNLRIDEKLGVWCVEFHARGKQKVGAEAGTPEGAMQKFLEQVRDHKLEVEIRSVIAAFFEPWIMELAAEQGRSIASIPVVTGGRVAEPGGK